MVDEIDETDIGDENETDFKIYQCIDDNGPLGESVVEDPVAKMARHMKGIVISLVLMGKFVVLWTYICFN